MQDAPDVVLVTLDTTRADAISCYGVPPGPYRRETRTTPVLDAIAAEGARFERFFAHAPSTLSSHASMLTGLDPHGHAVVRNGFPLNPAHDSLAERLGAEGWDTIAVLGSSALERAMGLDQGFRVYDDAEGELHGLQYQRTADAVVRQALAAVDARPDPGRPLFLWVHLYDPHAPFTPPDELARRFAPPGEAPPLPELTDAVRRGTASAEDIERVNGLYLAEVAFADQQLGVLLDGLRTRGRLERALLVVVADHGETLAEDEHYAWSHGSNVAVEVMRVPLVVRGYGMALAQRAVVGRQAAMSGLAPTIERLVGLPPILGDGLEFSALLRPGPVDDTDDWPDRPSIPALMEATRPRFAEDGQGWNNLQMHRGVVLGGWAVEQAPFAGQPWTFQPHGRLPDEAVLDTLAGMVDAWDALAPPHRAAAVAPSTVKALEALGYVE